MLNTLVKTFTSVALGAALLVVPVLPLTSNTAVAATPKLELVNTVNKNQANRGDILSYTIELKNTGDTSLSNTKFWVNPLNLATVVPGSASYTRSATGATHSLEDAFTNVTNNFGVIPAGQKVTIKFQTKVADNANHNDVIWIVANAKSDQTPTQLTTGAWTKVFFSNPGLVGEKLADKTTVAAGDTVTFTIKARNTGNVVLHDVFIGDVINAPFKYVAGSTEARIDNQVTKVADSWLTTGFNAGFLVPGQETTLTFKVTVAGQITDGQTLKNVASIWSNEIKKFNCAIELKAKVLGVVTPPVTPPTELPNTGPGEVLLLVSGLIPAGLAIKKFKSGIK